MKVRRAGQKREQVKAGVSRRHGNSPEKLRPEGRRGFRYRFKNRRYNVDRGGGVVRGISRGPRGDRVLRTQEKGLPQGPVGRGNPGQFDRGKQFSRSPGPFKGVKQIPREGVRMDVVARISRGVMLRPRKRTVDVRNPPPVTPDTPRGRYGFRRIPALDTVPAGVVMLAGNQIYNLFGAVGKLP